MSERQETASGKGLKVRTGVKAGRGGSWNRCETLKSKGLKVRTGVKAGLHFNRCETLKPTGSAPRRGHGDPRRTKLEPGTARKERS